jgi:hypothetical protein
VIDLRAGIDPHHAWGRWRLRLSAERGLGAPSDEVVPVAPTDDALVGVFAILSFFGLLPVVELVVEFEGPKVKTLPRAT